MQKDLLFCHDHLNDAYNDVLPLCDGDDDDDTLDVVLMCLHVKGPNHVV